MIHWRREWPTTPSILAVTTSEFCQENSWPIWNQTDYILCSQRWRSYKQSAKTRPGSDCGSDHQLLIAKFRLKPKKAGKITRPARYNLNQIPYEYAVEVMNRFKGLEPINSVPEELWMEVCNNVWEAANKTILNKKTSKKAKWFLRRSYK